MFLKPENNQADLTAMVQQELERVKKEVTESQIAKELEDCLTNMLIRSENAYIFYANIIMKMLKKVDINMQFTAGMTIEKAKFIFYAGPLFMNKYYTFDNRIADCVHEIEHFCRLHTGRRIALIGKHPAPDKMYICNLAMDFEINTGIQNIAPQPWSVFPWDFKLPKEKSMEWYYWELIKIQEEQAKQPQDNGKGKGKGGKSKGKAKSQDNKSGGENPPPSGDKDDGEKGPQGNHGVPTDKQGRPMLPQPGDGVPIDVHIMKGEGGVDPVMVEEMTRDLVNEVVKALGKGNLPGHVQELVDNLNKPRKINWKDLLRRYVGTAVKATIRKVWTRFNKRVPFTMLKGKTRDKGKTIVFVIDTSGSMSTKVINEAINEVKHIKRLQGSVVWMIHCDTTVEWYGKIEDFSDLPNKIYGRGGTDFRPAFKWPVEKKIRPDVMIFLTDGAGDYPSQAPRWPLIWLMVEGQKPSVKWGKVVNFPHELQYA